jgi:hypothetical protein
VIATSIALLISLSISLAADERDREPITAQVQALVVAPLAAGVAGELSLLLLESPERSLPLALRLDSDSVALVENRLGWSAVVDPQALQPRLRAPFRAPSEPGVYVVRASIDYQICAGEWCRQKRGEVEWTVEVVSAP